MTEFKLRVWRNTLGCPESPIIKICLGPIPGGPQFFPINMPWETATAIFGEVIEKVGENAVGANLRLDLEANP